MQQPEVPIEGSGAAPQRTSRGRIAAAVVLCCLAAVGLTGNYLISQRFGADMQRDAQARLRMFEADIILRLTYYLAGMRGGNAPGERAARYAARSAPTGAKAAAGYFQLAARDLASPYRRTVAAASAAALYGYANDDWRAVVALQETMETGQQDVLFFLVLLYANQRPKPEWLRSPQFQWIARNVPAHLFIESRINEKLGRAETVRELRQAMLDAGEPTVSRFGAAVLIALVLILAGLIVLLRGLGGRGFGPYAGLPPRAWGLWEGLELLGAWMVIYLVIGQMAALGALAGDTGLLAGILATYVVSAVVPLAWFAVAIARPGRLGEAGWRPLELRAAMSNGLGAYAAALPVVLAAGVLAWRLLPEPPPNPLIAIMVEARGGAAWALFLILACVAAPVVEETVFRGVLYGGMRKRWSLPVAALVSSAGFAAVHLNWASFGPVLVLGCALCVVYERTGSLLPGMIAHGVFNLATAVLILAFT